MSHTASRFNAFAPNPYTVSTSEEKNKEELPVGKATRPPSCKTFEQSLKFSGVGFRIWAFIDLINPPSIQSTIQFKLWRKSGRKLGNLKLPSSKSIYFSMLPYLVLLSIRMPHKDKKEEYSDYSNSYSDYSYSDYSYSD